VPLAQDLTSETMLAAVASLRNGAVEAPTVAWIVGIARHKLVDHWRAAEREERHLRLIASQPLASAEPIDPGLGMEVLGSLNPSQRVALTLRHVDRLSVPEVAALLGRSVTATENLLARARSAFREKYNAIDPAEATGA
jgi:RNA polymerase sigma-70 factor (ECF subfamily)